MLYIDKEMMELDIILSNNIGNDSENTPKPPFSTPFSSLLPLLLTPPLPSLFSYLSSLLHPSGIPLLLFTFPYYVLEENL